MENTFINRAKWIWSNGDPQSDEYSEFICDISGIGNTTLFICADSNYTVTVNGKTAAFGQYADYPYDKVYDKIDECYENKNAQFELNEYANTTPSMSDQTLQRR